MKDGIAELTLPEIPGYPFGDVMQVFHGGITVRREAPFPCERGPYLSEREAQIDTVSIKIIVLVENCAVLQSQGNLLVEPQIGSHRGIRIGLD